MSLDKVTLTLHEAKDIVGLLGVQRMCIQLDWNIKAEQRRRLLDNIDKIKKVLLNAKEE